MAITNFTGLSLPKNLGRGLGFEIEWVIRIGGTPSMKESLWYLNNAKEILKAIPVEDNILYRISKAYLAILEAINELLLTKKGFTKRSFPDL